MWSTLLMFFWILKLKTFITIVTQAIIMKQIKLEINILIKLITHSLSVMYKLGYNCIIIEFCWKVPLTHQTSTVWNWPAGLFTFKFFFSFFLLWSRFIWVAIEFQGPTATIMEKKHWHTSFDLGEKVIPLSTRNVDTSHIVRSPAGSPNIHWWGQGRIMIKARTSAFYWTMSCPIFFYFSGKHGDSCNKLH